MSTDASSQNMFLDIVDNFLKKDDREKLLSKIESLVKYHEKLYEQQDYFSQRDSFLSSLDLPIIKRDVLDEKSYQDKARERVMEML